MREIIRHHVEYGCKRMDKIEFTAPKEVLIRCEAGCEPTYKYTRPSKVGFKVFFSIPPYENHMKSFETNIKSVTCAKKAV